MGIITKQKMNTGIESDLYYKIDSIRAGMGESDYITCSCTIWLNTEARKNGLEAIKYNYPIHIKDGAVTDAPNIISAVYPLLQKHLEGKPDMNSYASNIEEKNLAALQTKNK